MNDLIPSDLLLHRPPMLLVDEMLSANSERAEAKILIDDTSSFFQPGKGVPSHIGMEYMAQTIGLIAGTISRERGDGAPLGYLLGTRKYQCNTRWFPPGAVLIIDAQEELSDDTLGVYQCNIRNEKGTVPISASAMLTVYKAGAQEATSA